MFRGKIVAFTSLAVGCVAGVTAERHFKGLLNSKSYHSANNNDRPLEPLPGLPIFGSVSAASPILPQSNESQIVPREPPQNAPRVSQVLLSL